MHPGIFLNGLYSGTETWNIIGWHFWSLWFCPENHGGLDENEVLMKLLGFVELKCIQI